MNRLFDKKTIHILKNGFFRIIRKKKILNSSKRCNIYLLHLKNIIKRYLNGSYTGTNSGGESKTSTMYYDVDFKSINTLASIMHSNFENSLANAKKQALMCSKEANRVFYRINRRMVVTAGPITFTISARRICRDILIFWKRFEREEKETRKRIERAAIEKSRLEEEAREARRQARKLNFLISQTELYGYFVAGKGKTLQDLDDVNKSYNIVDSNIDFADIDENSLLSKASELAMKAAQNTLINTREFDTKFNLNAENSSALTNTTYEVTQPRIVTGVKLKDYQVKGLSWLVSLYEQGINGILADEMGLGKTVQSISLLAYLAETRGIWGPFLIITPSSTLYNWQQEISRFVPEFKILPYWGSVTDRKALRRYWNPKKLSSRTESHFHIIITSYQLAVADYKYLNRLSWNYMILDEAQAIKSSSSTRWKTLLNFKCRNRLLLTGTPIQNSLAELWALLHFVMPGLFDSHDEFAAWFARDIESHVEHSTDIDPIHIQRLRSVLRPFMLRRVKGDVEKELSAKKEIILFCNLSPRQYSLYSSLCERISNDYLSNRLVGKKLASNDDDFFESLMNTVMQLRKICNHPELLLPRPIQAPFICDQNVFPKFVSPIYTTINLQCLTSLIPDRFSHSSLKRIFEKENSFRQSDIVQSDNNASKDAFMYINRELLHNPSAISTNSCPFSPIDLISDRFNEALAATGCEIQSREKFSGFSRGDNLMSVPTIDSLLQDSGKLSLLDVLLKKLALENHRCLIYSQMTKMLDLLESYVQHRYYSYIRLDGGTKISDRRILVNEWQSGSAFIFLLSTRAGGLGINLTAADTVIFYDSDWNPTVDTQAMDRAHRLGQTKEVTVYRLISRHTIEERILKRASQKNFIQKTIISAESDFFKGEYKKNAKIDDQDQVFGHFEKPNTRELFDLIIGTDKQ